MSCTLMMTLNRAHQEAVGNTNEGIAISQGMLQMLIYSPDVPLT